MPIANLSGPEALSAAKFNPFSHWSDDGVTRALTPKVSLSQADTLAAIGSPLSATIEGLLRGHDFEQPVTDALDTAGGLQPDMIAHTSAAALHSALTWAFGDDSYTDAFFEKLGSGWVDVGLPDSLRATDMHSVMMRRRALRTTYQALSQCNAVILSLGQIEVWFDTRTQSYLSHAPRRPVLTAQPDRFELHVHGVDQTRDMLRNTIELLRSKSGDRLRVVLLVDPEPQQLTYRDLDIASATTSAKSILRAAAEDVAQAYDFVDYIPVSDAQTQPVEPQLRHMIATLVDETAVSRAEVLAQLDHYRAHPKVGFDALQTQTDLCRDPKIAAVFVECAIAAGRLDMAAIALEMAEDTTGMLAAQLCMANEDFAGALAAMHTRPDAPRHLTRYFGMRIRANVQTGAYFAAVLATEEWAAITPNSPAPLKVLAKSLAQKGDPRAKHWFERAVKVSGGNTGIILEMADFLIQRGDSDAAKAQLKTIRQPSKREKRRKTRMLRAL